MAGQRLKVLVLCDFLGNNANVIRDYLYSFNRFSRHEFSYMHHWRNHQCRRLRNLDLDSFDVILFFWDCFWDVDNTPGPHYLPPWVRERIANSSALKVQFLQDEYREVRPINRVLASLGINLMFTCVAERDHEQFYPPNLIPSLQATYTVLTGYVPDYLERVDYPAHVPRPIDIGYRSRATAFYLGSLAQEKTQIATEFTRIGKQYGFTTDISVREEDRLYGQRWLDFLMSTRISLGTESGSSVVDLEGDLLKRTKQYVAQNPRATFHEVQERFLADVEGKLTIQTISPRVFEAAAFQNTLVLHEGAYAGLIQPGVHFIPVKKDYSNVEEVVAQMRDQGLCQRLAERTHDDLIGSGRFNYRSFVRRFDDILSSHRPRSARVGGSRLLFYTESYVNQDCLIPRGGDYVVLPHPVDIIKAINGRCPDLLCVLASIDLMLTMLSCCAPMRGRLLDALRQANIQGDIHWGGLMRDLRILAILNAARLRSAESNQPFRVAVDFDATANRLTFRSIPGTDKETDEPAALLRQLRQAQTANIVWDHSSVSNHFTLTHSPGQFFLIYINSQGTYRFEHLHELFGNEETQKAEVLAEVLCKPFPRSWPRRMTTLLKLGGSAAVGVVRRVLIALRKFLPSSASRERQESAS